MNSNQNNAPSRIVYLGSIPYDQTEQQILDLCTNVGPVINLRMMFDPTTGKSKGYAFIEFKDLESSASAVRNLNGYPLGNRFLKCGYSSNNDISNSSSSTNNNNNSSNNGNEDEDNDEGSMLFPGLPQGVDVNINMTTPAMMISSELAKYDKEKQLNLLRKLQDWCRTEPQLALQLLSEYPQLTYVVAELLLTNGICQVDDLTQLAANNNASNNNDTTSREDIALSSDPEQLQKQKDLLRQVLKLTDSDINVLPDNEKSVLWDLKQKVMKGEFGII
ncbi:mRNA 3'-end-processing protein Rna15p [Monosporozyma unispora]|nr:Component of the cleavage and polyadenylation factor I [Kazachstania unispora]